MGFLLEKWRLVKVQCSELGISCGECGIRNNVMGRIKVLMMEMEEHI